MPRLRVIVLDRPDVGDLNTYRVAFWADVPAARQPFYANASATSAWKDALAGDTTNLQNGSVVERVIRFTVPTGWTLAQIEAEVQSQWTAYQGVVTSWNGWQRYGTVWDGAAWTLGGVA